MLTELLEIFMKIVIILAAGYVFARKGVITPEMKKNLSSLLMKVVLYFSIISSSQQELKALYLKGYFEALLLSLLYYLLAIPVLGKMAEKCPIEERAKRVFVTMGAFANVGFIGFSMIGELVGDEGILYTAAVNVAFQLVFFSYGMHLLSGEKGEGLSIRGLLHNEALMVSAAAVVLYLLPYRFPAFLQSTLSTVGGMMMPLSMLIIGAEIAGMDIKEILKDPYSYLLSLMRLIVFPLVMLAAVKLMHLPANLGVTLVVLTALPSGSMNVIMAQEYDCDPEFATRSVAQSMLLMVATLPVIIILAKTFLA